MQETSKDHFQVNFEKELKKEIKKNEFRVKLSQENLKATIHDLQFFQEENEKLEKVTAFIITVRNSSSK